MQRRIKFTGGGRLISTRIFDIWTTPQTISRDFVRRRIQFIPAIECRKYQPKATGHVDRLIRAI